LTGGAAGEGEARMQEEAFSRLREQPMLLGLFNYWNHKRAGKDVADRRDIDPIDMPPALLPHLALVEIFDDDRVKLRLAGTELVRQHGRDNTGKFIDEYLKDDYLAYLTTLYTGLRAGRQPVLAESVFRHPGTHLETMRLILPLTHGGREIRMALLGQIFRYPGDRPRAPLSVPLDAGALEIVSQIALDVARDEGEA
jgi:hypothetical protein